MTVPAILPQPAVTKTRRYNARKTDQESVESTTNYTVMSPLFNFDNWFRRSPVSVLSASKSSDEGTSVDIEGGDQETVSFTEIGKGGKTVESSVFDGIQDTVAGSVATSGRVMKQKKKSFWKSTRMSTPMHPNNLNKEEARGAGSPRKYEDEDDSIVTAPHLSKEAKERRLLRGKRSKGSPPMLQIVESSSRSEGTRESAASASDASSTYLKGTPLILPPRIASNQTRIDKKESADDMYSTQGYEVSLLTTRDEKPKCTQEKFPVLALARASCDDREQPEVPPFLENTSGSNPQGSPALLMDEPEQAETSSLADEHRQDFVNWARRREEDANESLSTSILSVEPTIDSSSKRRKLPAVLPKPMRREKDHKKSLSIPSRSGLKEPGGAQLQMGEWFVRSSVGTEQRVIASSRKTPRWSREPSKTKNNDTVGVLSSASASRMPFLGGKSMRASITEPMTKTKATLNTKEQELDSRDGPPILNSRDEAAIDNMPSLTDSFCGDLQGQTHIFKIATVPFPSEFPKDTNAADPSIDNSEKELKGTRLRRIFGKSSTQKEKKNSKIHSSLGTSGWNNNGDQEGVDNERNLNKAETPEDQKTGSIFGFKTKRNTQGAGTDLRKMVKKGKAQKLMRKQSKNTGSTSDCQTGRSSPMNSMTSLDFSLEEKVLLGLWPSASAKQSWDVKDEKRMLKAMRKVVKSRLEAIHILEDEAAMAAEEITLRAGESPGCYIFQCGGW